MEIEEIVLVVEDTLKSATWQIQTMENTFPKTKILHARNLKEAHDILNNEQYGIRGILTDNGFPLVRGGERVGSRSIEGGAGTLLIKQIRSGSFGMDYQDIPIAWHTANIDDRKVNRVMGYEDETSENCTKCFEKIDEPWDYEEMCEFLKH